MTLTTDQKTLLRALSICSKALNDGHVPATSMFLFEATPGRLDISACDFKMIISTYINAETADTGRYAVPGKELLDYIGKCEPGGIKLTISENTLTVTAQRGNTAKFPCESGEDYPRVKNKATNTMQLPAEDFLEMLFKTMFAISNDELRPMATGLNICIGGDKATFTALNWDVIASHSLAMPGAKATNFIIPKQSLQRIQSLSPMGVLDIAISKTAIDINWGTVKTTSLLIDEKYPDYLAVTPTENNIHFMTERDGLISSVKRVLPFTDVAKTLRLDISESGLVLTASNINFAKEATENIDGILDGDPIVIEINGEYLLSVLNSFGDDMVWICLLSPKRAILLTDGARHVNPSKENLCMIMPLFGGK